MPKFLFTGRPPRQVEFPPEASDRKGAAHFRPGQVITLTRAEVLWITSHNPRLAARLKAVGPKDKVEDGDEIAPIPADPWASVREAPTPVVEDKAEDDPEVDEDDPEVDEDDPEPEPDEGKRRKRASKRKGKGKGKGKASTD